MRISSDGLNNWRSQGKQHLESRQSLVDVKAKVPLGLGLEIRNDVDL